MVAIQKTKDTFECMRMTIAKRDLFGADHAALLMVSGGSDSTALAYLMNHLREEGAVGALAMLHVNHKLRGQDAEDDAAFAGDLAALLNIPFFLCEIDIAAEAARTHGNIEAVARQERYIAAHEALSSVCQHEAFPLQCGRIVTAHTADDRIENFYMRSIVGTGPGGFRSMRYRNGPVVRPLLDLTREDLRQFLTEQKAQGISVALDDQGNLWREDATNAHTDRFRAYVRHKLIPQAKAWDAHMPESLVRTMNLIAAEDDMLDDMAAELIASDTKSIDEEDPRAGFYLSPSFGIAKLPLARRAVVRLLREVLGPDTRLETQTVEKVLDAFANGVPKSGYVVNIQGDLAVSANKRGVRVEPMAAFRARRKKR